MKQALKEQGSDFIVNPSPCDGIEGLPRGPAQEAEEPSQENFIEGMACVAPGGGVKNHRGPPPGG